MTSLSKMKNPAKFPLLFIPRVALDEAISMMVPFELINFSKISHRTGKIVKSLTARKRTYEVFLKIDHRSSVTIYGSKRNWELASSQDFSKNKAIDTYSCDYQLQHIKETYEYINRILNFSCRKLYYTIGHFISDHKSMIDWLRSQQESVEKLYIVSLTSYDNDLTYLLSNVKATEHLELSTENTVHFDWVGLLPNNLDLLHVDAWNCISFEQLLKMNNSNIFLRKSKLTSREINLFLKSWMASESNLNLEFFQVNIKNDTAMDTILDLPHQEVTYENGKTVENKAGVYQLFGGVEIKQSPGKTGVMATEMNGDQLFLALFIF
ncbi:unnamed protein product [Caenorhabditis brenneri]